MSAPSRAALLVAALAWVASACERHAGVTGSPRREDHGDLIVLHLYGSYYEMGRQQVELLGPVAHRLYEYQHRNYEKATAAGGWQTRLLDWGTRLLPWLGPFQERSGLFDEMNGAADAMGVPRHELLRSTIATSFGSTVFAATRSATADGQALIGRNVDWADGDGTMRPVVMHYHPNNGDLDFIMAGWPLIGAPAVGINEAGLALSFNFFVTDETVGILAQMCDRRALQTARTVEEGLRVYTGARRRMMPTYMVMGDAGGDIAMIECTPSACATFRPEADWFAQANSARTAEMIPLDRYRSPDSLHRQAAMEAAVRPHLGTLTPESATHVLRDRSNSRWVNDPTVANLFVLNAAVLHPASKTLWHATSMQPEGPFGSFLPFSVAPSAIGAQPLPPDPRFGTAEMDEEVAVISEARRAVRLYGDGDYRTAGEIWDTLATSNQHFLQPDRLAYARGVVRWLEGNSDSADRLFATLDSGRAPFEVRASGLLARAMIADQQGRRDQAKMFYRLSIEYIDGSPQYTDTHTEQLRSTATAGLTQASMKAPAQIPDLQYVPR
jgi:hypothetical protein